MIEHQSVRQNVPLAPLTTYKVGGPARYYAEPADLSELRDLLIQVPRSTDVVVLGRGSNVVISDKGIDGLVLRLGRSFQAADVKADGNIVAGAGVPLPKIPQLGQQC